MSTRTHHTPTRKTLVEICLALCLALCLVLSGCQSVSTPNNPRAGKTLYQYNLDNGSLALNDYDLDAFETHNGLKYYVPDGKVKSQAGIDVSDHQGEINWKKVKASGVDFVFLRIGYRGYTEGGIFGDDNFMTDLKEAKAAGLKVGAYFFSQAMNEDEAQEEARASVSALNGEELDLPLAYDLETDTSSDARTRNLDSDTITQNTLAFCKVVEDEGYRAMVYMNRNAAVNEFDLSQLQDYPIWYAEYADKPTLGFQYAIWQYTSNGSLWGIDGQVDINVLFTDAEL